MKFHIGMTLEKVNELLLPNDIPIVQDMNNGYLWIRGEFEIVSERIYTALCFKDSLLWMIIIEPHLSTNVKREPFSVTQEDYNVCKGWLDKHKEELPENAEVFYDKRTPSVGICIR